MNAPDRDTRACLANGCPCAGSMMTSTSGGGEWLCWQHLKAPASQWQSITSEMNRLQYLVDATKKIRAVGGMTHDKAEVVLKGVNASLRLAQRSDLCYHADDKHRYGWLSRLENELAKAARGVSTEQQSFAEMADAAA